MGTPLPNKFMLTTDKAEAEVRKRLLHDGVVEADQLAIASTLGVEALVTNNYYTFKMSNGYWLLVPKKQYEKFQQITCFADDSEEDDNEEY